MYTVDIQTDQLAQLWGAFAAASLSTCSLAAAATNADLMLEEFHRRFEWASRNVEGHPLAYGWRLRSNATP